MDLMHALVEEVRNKVPVGDHAGLEEKFIEVIHDLLEIIKRFLTQ